MTLNMSKVFLLWVFHATFYFFFTIFWRQIFIIYYLSFKTYVNILVHSYYYSVVIQIIIANK